MGQTVQHRIVVQAVQEYVHNGLSTNTAVYPDKISVARTYLRNWWEYNYGPEPRVLTVTVDGETFTAEQIRSYKG